MGIFETAERLIGRADSKTAIVFVGQGMRPLFESVRAINELNKTVPAKNLIYVVTPEFSYKSAGHHIKAAGKASLAGTAEGGRAIEEHRVALVKNRLLKHKRGIAKKKRILIVDYRAPEFSIGSNMRTIKDAIKSINPSTEVIELAREESLSYGIYTAEHLKHPTTKDFDGNLSRSENKLERDEYLLFQRELQKYLTGKKKKTKK